MPLSAREGTTGCDCFAREISTPSAQLFYKVGLIVRSYDKAYRRGDNDVRVG